MTTQLEEVLTTQLSNLYDHLKTFIKLELKNRTKVELRYSKLGRLEDANQTYVNKEQEVSVEIDTSDSLPITQKPYTLPLKHTTWVQRELELLEKAGVIVRSVSPWANPIVIVPKRTAPGEPPKRRLCVDY